MHWALHGLKLAVVHSSQVCFVRLLVESVRTTAAQNNSLKCEKGTL